MKLDMETLSLVSAVIAGLLLTNIGALVSAYVSLKVSIARVEVKVDNHDKDLNNLGGILRENVKKPNKES